jgi:hypothetical protein
MSTIYVNLVCLQETKIKVIDRYIIMQCLGPMLDQFSYLWAMETSGGIMLAWDSLVLEVANVSLEPHALTWGVHTKDGNISWLTVVYVPQSRVEKIEFLQQLAGMRSMCRGP